MTQQPPIPPEGQRPPQGVPPVRPEPGQPLSSIDLAAARAGGVGVKTGQAPPVVPGHPGPPPLPPRREGGFKRGFGAGLGWALGAGLVALVVGVVTTGIFTLGVIAIGSTSSSSDTTPAITVWGESSARNTVLAIPVTGVILGDSAGQGSLFSSGVYGYDVAARLDALDEDDADAVILELNTPGGTIYGARAISDAVERYQERTGNPVVAYVRGTSASGGMYAMAGADKIIVDHGTMVGSIGVIMGPFERYRDVTAVDGGLLAGGVTAGGIENYYITRGKGKDLGNPYRDMTPEERASLDTWMDAEYQAFVQHVAERRDIPAQTIIDNYGAYMFGPQQAIQNKLADAELGQEEAYREVAELAGVDPDDTKVQMEQADISLLGSLLGGSSQAQPGSAESDAAQLAQGQAVLRSSALCTGEGTVLAFDGDLAQVCSG